MLEITAVLAPDFPVLGSSLSQAPAAYFDLRFQEITLFASNFLFPLSSFCDHLSNFRPWVCLSFSLNIFSFIKFASSSLGCIILFLNS